MIKLQEPIFKEYDMLSHEEIIEMKYSEVRSSLYVFLISKCQDSMKSIESVRTGGNADLMFISIEMNGVDDIKRQVKDFMNKDKYEWEKIYKSIFMDVELSGIGGIL